jgi:rhamnosyltransferase
MDVAILLATYNGARYLNAQLSSLTQNETPFVLHWLDDHSTDGTRVLVEEFALRSSIPLRRWHQPERLGVPATFFKLLECAKADVYLFCDQDDIWQPGKIDATVAALKSDVETPVLCFSDALMFNDGNPEERRRITEAFGLWMPKVLEASRAFMCIPAAGHTYGFSRPLRDLFIQHKDIAREYACMHDAWMYDIAVAAGVTRFLTSAPTTLYRIHGNNVSGPYFQRRKPVSAFMSHWRQHQRLRRMCARHAKGFVLAANTLPSGPNVQRQLGFAQLVAHMDKRQSLASVFRLLRSNVMCPKRSQMALLSVLCLFSSAQAEKNGRDVVR